MNLPDAKQLVRESSGHIEEPNSTRKMGAHAKLAWTVLFFCLGLFAWAHCVPVEVIYTDEGCECPSKLGYAVNVPSVPSAPKKYQRNEYGYRVDAPTPRHTKVTYSFDFAVEEPRTPKPVKPTKLNLYATVDRVAVKRGDCEDSYAAPSAPSTCRCGQYGISKPLYGYVLNSMTPSSPCKCGRANCQCNRCHAASTQYSPNAIFMGRPLSAMPPQPTTMETGSGDEEHTDLNSDSGGAGFGAVNIRRKRDLQRTLFRPRTLARERPNRFVKLYHKNLSNTPHRLFDFNGRASRQLQQPHHQEVPKKAKRKAKKTRYAHKRSRLVKRDIKGEYEQLEKEHEQMDLTLPEIIQYMPETLQPNFKRGQCYFGCGAQHLSQPMSAEIKIDIPGSSSNSSSSEYSSDSKKSNAKTDSKSNTNTNGGMPEKHLDMSTVTEVGTGDSLDNAHFTQSEKAAISAQNEIGSTYTKRNAANYHTGGSLSSAESACPSCTRRLPVLLPERAYHAHFPTAPPISTNLNYEPQQPTYPNTAQSAAQPIAQATAKVPASRQYLGSKGYLSTVSSSHATALPSAGDLESPSLAYSSYPQDRPPSVAAQHHPVQHITNENLDKIIADIVRQHPAFIDATSHYGGALVDPEPWQEQQTKSFIKNLADGRLDLRFGHEDINNPLQYGPSYSSSPRHYGVPPLDELLPPLY